MFEYALYGLTQGDAPLARVREARRADRARTALAGLDGRVLNGRLYDLT
jgi:hypothetical protein